jgi:fructoselysine-6-P-deglycase FrlB-like protein
MTSFMFKEISEQPDLFETKIKEWTETSAMIQPAIKGKSNIVLLGRGTSGNACVFASYLFGLTTGRHPIDFRPWLATQHTPPSDWSDSVFIYY